MQILPNLDTKRGLEEKDLFPIILFVIFRLTSRTGTVFIFIPSKFNK